MQSINAERARRLCPQRPPLQTRAAVGKAQADLLRRLRRTLCFARSDSPLSPKSLSAFDPGGLTVERIVFESEPGMPVPALLFAPEGAAASAPLLIHASDAGKPTTLDGEPLPLLVAKAGFPVLSIDARDTGETSLGPIPRMPDEHAFSGARWQHDRLAIRALGTGASREGLRVLDIMRAVDFARGRDDLKDRPVAVAGEGLLGVAALAAAALDARIAAAASVRTLSSYLLLTGNAVYNRFDYFWTPSVLRSYDITDLPALVAPRPTAVIEPVDHMGRALGEGQLLRSMAWSRGAFELLEAPDNLVLDAGGGPRARCEALARLLGLVKPA